MMMNVCMYVSVYEHVCMCVCVCVNVFNMFILMWRHMCRNGYGRMKWNR